MTQSLRLVAMGEMVVSSNPEDVLVAYGLGSCVAVCLFDPAVPVGGMLHAVLPILVNLEQGPPTRSVAQGLPMLLSALIGRGASLARLRAYLCGGAQILMRPGSDDVFNIGQRNVEAARAALRLAGLETWTEATGGRSGRTIRLYLTNGEVTVRKLDQPEYLLKNGR